MKKSNIQSEVVMEYQSPFSMPSINFDNDGQDEEAISGDDRQDDGDEDDVEGVQSDRFRRSEDARHDDIGDGDESEEDEESEERDEEDETYGDDEYSEERGDDDEDIEGESSDLYGGIARLLMQDGYLPTDYEIKELNGEKLYKDIVDRLKQESVIEAERELEAKGYNEETLKYASLIAQGVDPAILNETVQFKMLSEIDSSDADNAEFLVRQMYQHKQYSDKDTERILTKILEDDSLGSSVSEAKEFFEKKYKSSIKQKEDEHNRFVEKQKEDHAKYKETVKKVVFENSIPGLEKQVEKDQFLKDLFEPTEVYEYKEGTKTVRSKISKYQKLRLDFDNDISKQLILARKILLGDFNDSEAFEQGRNAVAEEIFKKVVVKQNHKSVNKQPFERRQPIKSEEVFVLRR